MIQWSVITKKSNLVTLEVKQTADIYTWAKLNLTTGEVGGKANNKLHDDKGKKAQLKLDNLNKLFQDAI